MPIRRLRSRSLLAALAAALLCAGGGAVALGHPMDLTDVDHDQVKNEFDNCPGNYNPKQQDNDQDSAPKATVGEPTSLPGQNGSVGGPLYGWTENATLPDGSTPDPRNRPAGIGGDACDEDDDNDGLPDKRTSRPEYKGKTKDNCSKVANPGQEDADFDGAGDACDADDDNDNVDDAADNCPLISNAGQLDGDGDRAGDACDPDAPEGGSLRGRDPNDRTAPDVKVSVARTHHFDELALGLAVPVRCSEGCQLEGELVLDGRTARKLKMARSGGKRVVVARGAAQIEDKGFTFVFVKFSKKKLKRLERAGRLRPVLRVTAEDANGNKAVAQRRVSLRR